MSNARGRGRRREWCRLKGLIVIECGLLWVGTVFHYAGDFGGDLTKAVVAVGVRSAIPTVMLMFVLLLLADLGAEGIAVLFGGIVAFSYLMDASALLNNIVSYLLSLSGYHTAGGGASSDR